MTGPLEPTEYYLSGVVVGGYLVVDDKKGRPQNSLTLAEAKMLHYPSWTDRRTLLSKYAAACR